MSVPSPRGLMSRDSCQQATQKSFGTSRHVFEDILAPSEPSTIIFGKLRSMASASCGPAPLSTGRILSEQMNWKETLRILQIPHRDLQGHVLIWNPSSYWKELIRKVAWLSYRGIKSENCISINSPNPPAFQFWKTNFKTAVCSCSGCR